jgi:hypothetical protein
MLTSLHQPAGFPQLAGERRLLLAQLVQLRVMPHDEALAAKELHGVDVADRTEGAVGATALRADVTSRSPLAAHPTPHHLRNSPAILTTRCRVLVVRGPK